MANELLAAGRLQDRLQVFGCRDGSEDRLVAGAGPVYRWSWQTLKRLPA